MQTLIVAEIASNWEGSLVKAKKLIEKAKKAGADAVKFQMWRATDLYSNDHPEWDFIKKSELTFDKTEKIKKMADEQGIDFFCSCFYPEAVDFLETLNVKNYKIASRTCLLEDPNSKETLFKKSITKKPVFISMGMGGNKKYLEKLFKNSNITFCYCISEYPTEIKKINWKTAVKFDGFSDHTLGITAPILFATLKKQMNSKQIMIEKHVKLKESKGPDASTSIDTNQLSELVNYIRNIEKLKI